MRNYAADEILPRLRLVLRIFSESLQRSYVSDLQLETIAEAIRGNVLGMPDYSRSRSLQSWILDFNGKELRSKRSKMQFKAYVCSLE